MRRQQASTTHEKLLCSESVPMFECFVASHSSRSVFGSYIYDVLKIEMFSSSCVNDWPLITSLSWLTIGCCQFFKYRLRMIGIEKKEYERRKNHTYIIVACGC